MDFSTPPEFWWSTDILLIINSSLGMDQEIHPSGQGRSDSVKINPSLLRMRECLFQGLDGRRLCRRYIPSSFSSCHLVTISNFQNCRRYTLHRLTGSDNWHAGLWGNLSQFDTFQLLTTHCSKALFTTVDSTVFSFVHNVSCFALSYKLDFRCAGSRVEVVKILVYLDLLDAKVLDMLFPKG